MRRPVLALLALSTLLVACSDGASVTAGTSATEATTEPTTEATTEPAPPTTNRAETAERGSVFCERAAVAESLGDVVNQVRADPVQLESALRDAMEAIDAALELAPSDIIETMTRSVEYQHQVVTLLEANGWDPVAAYATDEGAALFDDQAAQQDRDDVRAYFEEKCGIVDDSDQPAVTIDGTESVDLPDGDAGIDRFIDLFAAGSDTEVTDEQRQCLKDAMRDEVTVEQLEVLVGGGTDEAAQIAIGLAFVDCGVIDSP